MCKKKQFRYCSSEIDDCLRRLISILNSSCLRGHLKTIASCCGHKKYHPTIIVRGSDLDIDIFSGVWMRRKKQFYKRDKQGYYYIPEVEADWKEREEEK